MGSFFDFEACLKGIESRPDQSVFEHLEIFVDRRAPYAGVASHVLHIEDLPVPRGPKRKKLLLGAWQLRGIAVLIFKIHFAIRSGEIEAENPLCMAFRIGHGCPLILVEISYFKRSIG